MFIYLNTVTLAIDRERGVGLNIHTECKRTWKPVRHTLVNQVYGMLLAPST